MPVQANCSRVVLILAEVVTQKWISGLTAGGNGSASGDLLYRPKYALKLGSNTFPLELHPPVQI